jgi:hypothetical protein
MSAICKKMPALVVLLLLTLFSTASGAAPDSFVLTGRILDIDGQPVAGAELFVYDSAIIRRPADFISARTGQDGRFSLTLPRKNVWLVARERSSDKFGPLLPGDRHSGEALLVEPDDRAELQQDFTIVNIREAVRQKQKIRSDFQGLSGRIVDQQGKPVGNAYVFAHSEQVVRGVPEYISAWSDDGGGYSLHLPPGRYYLGASTIFPLPQGGRASLELVVGTGENAVAIDVKLSI